VTRPLISVAELRRLLERNEAVCLLDCRFDLAASSAGERAFAAAHIPGAHHAHLEHDLSGPPGPTGAGRHPLPSAEAWQARLARWGVRPGTQVVAYDDTGGCFAARAWWLCRYFGHENVSVLDGGWPAWVAVGGDRDSRDADVRAAPAELQDRVDCSGAPATSTLSTTGPAGSRQALVTCDGLADKLLVDARDPARYAGTLEPIDPRAGHIPGAVNRFWKRNLDADGYFLPVEELRAAWLELLGGAAPPGVVCYCGSGVTACHNLLALAHCGIEGVRLYPGSWSEYCADPERPAAVGPEPGPRLTPR